MEKIYHSIAELVGGTPLLEPRHYEEEHNLSARLLLKLEYLNPAGSVKDRAALNMIEDAEQKGLLKPGAAIIEATSGNTGIGLAAVAASRGYRTIIVMPDSMSAERRMLMKAFGAELVLTDGAKGMIGATEKAAELAAQLPGSFIAGQFENPANAEAHYKTTGPELWQDSDGKIDAFVAGVGTGGTITGIGRYLKAQNPQMKIVAVEPAGSPLLSKGVTGKHNLQGIGANFVPKVLDRSILDEIIPVTDENAYAAARELGRWEGIVTGITSGAALHAARVLAERPEMKGKTIAVLLPDTGDRYLSTPLYEG